MPYWPLIQMGLTPQDGYDFAWEGNFRPGPGANYPGLKQQDWNQSEHGIYELNQFHHDTLTVTEMLYLESIINDTLNSRQQIPIPVIKHFIPDSANITEYDGEIYWFRDRLGPSGSFGADDINSDGFWDRAIITVKAGTPQRLSSILQEGASSIFGPFPVFNANLFGKTIIHEAGGNPGHITLADEWLLRLIENYDNLENIDNILGGESTYSYMKNVVLLNTLMNRIELEATKKNPIKENFNIYHQEFIRKVQEKINQ